MKQNRSNLLPPDLRALPTVTAKHYMTISPDPMFFIEGPAFDRVGNFYICCALPFPIITPRLFRISPEGKVDELFCVQDACVMGMAIHADGRLFVTAVNDGFLIISPEGELLRRFVPKYQDEMLVPNDCVFDPQGNLYFTDFRGAYGQPEGGIYRLEASDDYETVTPILQGMKMPNGIAFSPDYRKLWIGESGENAVVCINFGPDGFPDKLGVPVNYVYRNSGIPMPDGTRTDSAGNVYQAMQKGGRVLILDSDGIPIQNVIVPDRLQGKYDNTPNLVIEPGTTNAYLLASGSEGVHLFRFDALAPAQMPYSHKKD